jgi:CPA2 family monovalent cation:H+ antiporter-2
MVEDTSLAVAEIGGILLAAAIAGYSARRVGLPAIVGYLAVGLLVSPFTPGYVADRRQIQLLADIGVVFLLFEVGIEIDLRQLGGQSRRLLMAVPLQVAISAAVSFVVTRAMGVSVAGSALIGLAIALSSSVVVVNITRSRRRTASPETADVMLGWSVLQDLAGTGAALVVIALHGLGGESVGITLLRMVGFVVLTFVCSRLLPLVLGRLHAEHDLFLLVSVSSALVIAGVGASAFAVPLALAAFVGGLTVGESREASAARERLLPFRDLFAVLFFVAVGTLFDPSGLRSAWPWALLIIGLVVVVKAAPTLALARFLRAPGVHAPQVAVGLAQVGEFSFVLASLGVAHGLLPSTAYTGLLAGVVITIPASSVLARAVRPRRGRSAPVTESSQL